MPETTLITPAVEPQTADYQLIKDKIPAWLPAASKRNRDTLRNADTGHVDWLVTLTNEQREQLKQYNQACALSQQAVDDAMAPLQDVEAFARPLLQQALKARHQVELDVDNTFVHLRKPFALGALEIRVADFSVLTLSLLQAALHNFEAAECEPAAFDASSRFCSGMQSLAARVDTSLSIPRFLTLCRSLDIGAQYQTYLKGFLDAAEGLQGKVIQAQKDALQAAAYLALLKQDITPGDYQVMRAVIEGQRDIRDDGKPVWFSDLSIMGLRLHGCTAFVPVEKYQHAMDVLLYIPHDPHHPLKKYASNQAMEEALTHQLMAGAVGAELTPYQQFFRRFLAYADQPTYFRRLTQDAANSPADPFVVLRSPITRFLLPFVSAVVSIWLEPRELPPKPQAPREPIDNPNLYIRVLAKGELWDTNVDLFADNFAKLRDKLIADARSHAVPTADVDARVRAEKIAALESVGLLALNLVSMLIPGLGEVMMGVMAAQLLYETFEGIVEWHEGDRETALAHLTDVAENLALLGVMAAGGAGLSRVLKTPARLESVKPVTLASGERKLWKTDLTPYKFALQLDPEAKPDALGLHAHFGETVLPLEGDHYLVRQNPDTAQYHIQHPTRADAYAPLLEHNHEGGWQHEAEAPLTWDEPTLLRRLGLPAKSLSAERLQQARFASGIESDALRAGHLDQDPVPLALVESLKRLRIQDELTRFVRQMKSPDPAEYGQAEVALQMDLLARRGLLADTPLQVFDYAGRQLWDAPAPARLSRRAVILPEGGLPRGELLQEVLYTLQGADPALREFPGRAEDSLAHRAGLLRNYLGEQVDIFKDGLAEERYQAQAGIAGADAARLIDLYPGLPVSMAEHLAKGMADEQRQALLTRGEVSDALDGEARWQVQESRVARAYEGLFADEPGSVDSQRLALRTLETLPGWPRATRVELRHYSTDGEVLDAIGAPDAASRKVLVLQDNGLFEGSLPRDFYSATWNLLSAEERQAMGVTTVEQLKARIQQAPLPREPLRTVLAEYPIRKPAYDPSMRLLGGGPGLNRLLAQAGNLFRTPEARVQRLYPRLDEAEVAVFIQSLGEDVRGSLSRLEAEYARLQRDLKHWVRANAPQSSLTAFDRRGGFAATFAQEIERCWRREITELKIVPGQPLPLPAITADFSHVERLELGNTPWSDDAQTFLDNFKQLKVLHINNVGLGELPASISDIPRLTGLSLSHNLLRLTPQSVARLNRLRGLETLDLSHNRLVLAPDLSGLDLLTDVDLSYTQLEQWPAGLGEQSALRRLDLRHNALTAIPDAHLKPAPEQLEKIARINGATALLGNAGLLSSGDALDLYWRELTAQRPDLASLAGSDNFAIETPLIRKARRLYPAFSIRQAREHIWSLGDSAEAVLTERDQALTTLTDQLNAWAFSGGGVRQRYVRMGQVEENAATRDDRYIAKAHIIACWKGDALQKFAADGTPIGLELNLRGLHLPSLPDLDADFSHVGSLNLSGMQLTTSPEGFLARYHGLRWLDMSGNQLRELPPAVGQMNRLTKLLLQGNQIRLTPQTAQILAERASLRGLWLDRNPLGITPDLRLMTDMRSLGLGNTGIANWPEGLGGQPFLDRVELNGNRITALPDAIIAPADAHLEQSARLSNVVNLADNPLTPATLRRVREYGERLNRAGLTSRNQPARLVATALGTPTHALAERTVGASFERWATGLTEEQRALRQAQWLDLSAQRGSDGFLRMLQDLETTSGQHADLRRRVWEVIDSISQHSAESDALRQQMFDWAGRPACCDRAALSFSNVEIMSMVYKARLQASDQSQGAALIKLSRGLFRLDEVEKTALADIAARKALINRQPGLSSLQREQQIARLEEVEIRLAYRLGLKDPDRLDLPGQASQGRFINMAQVSRQTLDKTCARILALNGSPEEFQALVSRDFWQEFVTHKYRPQFDTLAKPFHEKLAELHDRMAAGKLSSMDYEARAKDLQARLAIEEAMLIERLTRAELAA